jgi:hypothetical protein
VHQAEPAADYGSESVGADDDTGAKILRHSAGSERSDTAYATRYVARDIGDSHTFFDAGTRGFRGTEQDVVEHGPAQRKTAVTERGKPFHAGELGLNRLAARRPENHTGEMSRARGFYFSQNSHVGEYARCLRAQVLGAHLVAGEVGAIQHQNVDAGLRKRPRRRRSSRTATNDDYIGVAIWETRQPTARETR